MAGKGGEDGVGLRRLVFHIFEIQALMYIEQVVKIVQSRSRLVFFN